MLFKGTDLRAFSSRLLGAGAIYTMTTLSGFMSVSISMNGLLSLSASSQYFKSIMFKDLLKLFSPNFPVDYDILPMDPSVLARSMKGIWSWRLMWLSMTSIYCGSSTISC